MSDENESIELTNPCHPGEVLRDWIEGHSETVSGAARRLNISRAKLNRILAGKGGILPDTAVALESIGWSSAQFWLRMQMIYDLARARARRNAAA